MKFLRVVGFLICSMCLGTLAAQGTSPSIAPIDYGIKGIGALSPDQSRALLNCYLAGDAATKIVELRGEGKSSDEIIKHYEKSVDKGWMKLIHDVLPFVVKDNPPASTQVEYGSNFYGKCLDEDLNEKALQVALYCYRLNQFSLLAFSFRSIGDPMEAAYTKMPVHEKVKLVTDELLMRAKKTDKSKEVQFRAQTYYGCLGHPEINPMAPR
ncbi:hypothetical protein [Acidovorax sp. A1169]|uniref:hypothetical protein n=1 Tax=Acidovorax sp. A1169 TaxID=3059524 RepID=UPI002737B609|nr:hypothetical protein [Acidovorax sp. A1169]MDP4074364.1 hypothetical protein [Acidovorax sp. A1169]